MARSKRVQEVIDGAMSICAIEGQVGLGVDIVDVSRMRRILERTPSFASRWFSSEERKYCESKANPAMHYGARFAAKEAVAKALGTGFAGMTPRDVEVVVSDSGKPEVAITGGALDIARQQGIESIPISLSHTDDDCIAVALALTKESQARPKERDDAKAQLAKRFKEARSVLDDIDASKGPDAAGSVGAPSSTSASSGASSSAGESDQGMRDHE